MRIQRYLMIIFLLTGVANVLLGTQELGALKNQYDSSNSKLPIVYDPGYNVSISPYLDWMIRLFHPFDTQKYAKVYDHLTRVCGLQSDQFYVPEKISDEQLLKVHPQSYLDSLSSSRTISHAVDLEDGLSLIPNRILQKAVLDPMRLATGGTLLATRLALQHGWAINLSGGYHHARYDHAGGGCIFGDIQLAVETVWESNPDARVLIVDLDAHQGNGYEDYFKQHRNTDQVFIFDMYNKNEYPWDEDGSADRIDYPIALDGGQLVCTIAGVDVSSVDYAAVTEHIEGRSVDTDEYLAKLASLHDYIIDLQKAGNGPDLIIYNAGTDPFIEDDWGGLAVSFDGMIQRDQFVWQVADKNNIPIVMLLSGGYSSKSAAIVAQSIEKTLRNKVGLAGHA